MVAPLQYGYRHGAHLAQYQAAGMPGHAYFPEMGDVGVRNSRLHLDLFGKFPEPRAQNHSDLRQQRTVLFYESDRFHDAFILIHEASLCPA